MKDTYLIKCDTNGNVSRIKFDKANSYKQLSNAVEGYIECAPAEGLPPMVDLFVNEEGKLRGLDYNEKLSRVVPCDLIVGNGVFCGHNKMGESVGLTEEQCKTIEGLLAD